MMERFTENRSDCDTLTLQLWALPVVRQHVLRTCFCNTCEGLWTTCENNYQHVGLYKGLTITLFSESGLQLSASAWSQQCSKILLKGSCMKNQPFPDPLMWKINKEFDVKNTLWLQNPVSSLAVYKASMLTEVVHHKWLMWIIFYLREGHWISCAKGCGFDSYTCTD